MPDLPRQLPLAAGDCYMHGQDFRMRRAGAGGNICRIVLHLEGEVDVPGLRKSVLSSPLLDWLGRARIVRRLSVFPPEWRIDGQPPSLFREHHEPSVRGIDAVPAAVLDRELPPGTGPVIAVDLVHQQDRKALVLSWNHALMDARGAEFVLRHLHSGTMPAADDVVNPLQRQQGWRTWWKDLMHARRSLPWLTDCGRAPVFSLGGAAPRSTVNRYRLISFTPAESARMEEQCQRLSAGFRRSTFHLAASIRAMHVMAAHRGNREGAYLIPVPHDMRRRGAAGPIFSNHLSILFYRIDPPNAAAMRSILESLTRQMMDQIRDNFPTACMAAMNAFKFLPPDAYVRQLAKPSQGAFATFSFSDSGETCAGLTALAGGRITGATHWVSAWRPPGLTVIFWSFRGQPAVQLSWLEDCLSADEVELFEQSLRAALLDEEPT